MPHTAMLQDPALVVADLMERWPETIKVFLNHHMLCVGCMVGPFHTVHDACVEHHVDERAFRLDLDAAVRVARDPIR